jgi:hypothetical protein
VVYPQAFGQELVAAAAVGAIARQVVVVVISNSPSAMARVDTIGSLVASTPAPPMDHRRAAVGAVAAAAAAVLALAGILVTWWTWLLAVVVVGVIALARSQLLPQLSLLAGWGSRVGQVPLLVRLVGVVVLIRLVAGALSGSVLRSYEGLSVFVAVSALASVVLLVPQPANDEPETVAAGRATRHRPVLGLFMVAAAWLGTAVLYVLLAAEPAAAVAISPCWLVVPATATTAAATAVAVPAAAAAVTASGASLPAPTVSGKSSPVDVSPLPVGPDPGFQVIPVAQVVEAARHVRWGLPRDDVVYGIGDHVRPAHGTPFTRPTGVQVRIRPEQLGTGTAVNRSLFPPPGYGGNALEHARAHLWGRQLGGPGDDPRNLVALYRQANSVAMLQLENRVAAWLQRGETVRFVVIPQYDRPNARLPSEVLMYARSSTGATFAVRIPNIPGAGTTTASNVKD